MSVCNVYHPTILTEVHFTISIIGFLLVLIYMSNLTYSLYMYVYLGDGILIYAAIIIVF